MSIKRYIHFDSSFRDRTQWPTPSEFEVPVSVSGRNFTSTTARDPVSNSSVLFAWSSGRFSRDGGGEITGTIKSPPGNASTLIGSTTTGQTFIVELTHNSFGQSQHIDNYYVGAVARAYTGVNGGDDEDRRIVASKYIGISNDTAELDELIQITVDRPFSDTIDTGHSLTITDPTDFTITDHPVLFVPAGRDGENAYYGTILYNETTQQGQTITEYDATTRLITIKGDTTGWTKYDNFSIRRQLPWYVFEAQAATNNTVTIPSGSSVGDIVGGFLRVQATENGIDRYNYGSLTAPINEIYRIVNYNPSTYQITVSPNFSNPPNISNPQDPDPNIPLDPNRTFTTVRPRVEILPFSKDNLNPFSYSGSVLSETYASCYELELVSLILPNQILKNEYGNRIAFYPYVWVEISNTSTAEGAGSTVIYSNNPHSNKMKFMVPITDVSHPNATSFVNLDSANMKQTFKFRVNDTLKFSVRMPNGELFDTLDEETFSPNYPNRMKQINAVFSIQKI